MRAEFVFGGTFDPVHFGHLAIIDALQTLSPETAIRVLLCALPPLKSKPQTAYADRLTLLKLALTDRRGVIIDTREQRRDSPSYTVESLASLKQAHPDHCFVLVMGMDSLLTLQQWYHWQQLASMCHVLVINRPGSDLSQAQSIMRATGFTPVASFDALVAGRSGNGMALTMPEKMHSSTTIRKAITDKVALDTLLPPSVIDYISNNHLYESENT